MGGRGGGRILSIDYFGKAGSENWTQNVYVYTYSSDVCYFFLLTSSHQTTYFYDFISWYLLDIKMNFRIML